MVGCKIFLCRGCMIVFTSLTTVKSKKKKVYSFSTFGKSILTHLTTMWCSQGSDSRKILLRDCVIYCMKRLHDFLCGEVAWLFVWRGFLVTKCFLVKQFFGGKKSCLRETFFLGNFFLMKFVWQIFFVHFFLGNFFWNFFFWLTIFFWGKKLFWSLLSLLSLLSLQYLISHR